jgi:DNA-binding IclR family transcriptional regulator
MNADARTSRIQAVDRAAELLKAVAAADIPRTAAELAQQCGLNRTTAWRMLATLEDHGLVERDAAQRYAIGYGAVALAQSPSGVGALVRVARPALQTLAEQTRETVTLSIARNGAVVAIDQIDPPDATLLLNYLSNPLPLHLTSNGRVVLANMSDGELSGVLSGSLERRTPDTVVDAAQLRTMIDEVRARGYAVTLGELDLGVNGVSVGVNDAQDNLVAIISVSAPASRLTEKRIGAAVPKIRRAVREVQARLREQT